MVLLLSGDNVRVKGSQALRDFTLIQVLVLAPMRQVAASLKGQSAAIWWMASPREQTASAQRS